MLLQMLWYSCTVTIAMLEYNNKYLQEFQQIAGYLLGMS